MKKKVFLSFVFLVVASVFITMILSSCTKYDRGLPNQATGMLEENLSQNQNPKLPNAFDVEKIKNALSEYINYRMWLYPSKIKENYTPENFDNFINKSIDIEIRVYNTDAVKSVYGHTSIGHLLTIKNENGFVYCNGQVREGDTMWPVGENYQVVEKYTYTIQSPKKPNYGASTRKDEMISKLESTVKSACESYYNEDAQPDKWTNLEVYIADFYEYEMGAWAWICRQDGTAVCFPVHFEIKNGLLEIQPAKSYEINENELSEYTKHLFERDISDAVRVFKCNFSN